MQTSTPSSLTVSSFTGVNVMVRPGESLPQADANATIEKTDKESTGVFPPLDVAWVIVASQGESVQVEAISVQRNHPRILKDFSSGSKRSMHRTRGQRWNMFPLARG